MATKYVPVSEITEAERVKRQAVAKIRRTCKIPGTNLSLIGAPSKMPGGSWGMTAGASCPGAHYAPNLAGAAAICSGCYAIADTGPGVRGGMYAMPNVRVTYRARFDWARLAVRRDPDQFVAVMVAAIRFACDTLGEPYFRVHDSGDLFSPAYTRAWIRVCAALPEIKFWFPTRSYRLPWAALIADLHALPNVAVKPSALHVEDAPPVVEGLGAGTSASSTDWTCPSSLQGGHCGDCRACWDKGTARIYRLHGQLELIA